MSASPHLRHLVLRGPLHFLRDTHSQGQMSVSYCAPKPNQVAKAQKLVQVSEASEEASRDDWPT